MAKRRKQQHPNPTYTLLIQPTAYRDIKSLPGYVRQRVRRAVEELIVNPQPHGSRKLDQELVPYDVYRLRLEQWRIIYVVDEEWQEITIVAARQRPPYQYDDLDTLLKEFGKE